MVSRWRRHRQLRRKLRSHRAPRGWRPPPPPVEADAPDARVEVGGPDEDSGELTVRGLGDAGQATVGLALGSRAADEVVDEGWVAEPEPEEPPDGSRPRSRRFVRTAAWVLGLIVVTAAAIFLVTHLG